MRLPTKIVVGSLGLVLVGALALRSGRGERFSLNPLTPIRSETQRLDAAIESANHRIQVGQSLVVALVDGHVTLADATRDYLALHENDPAFHEYLRLHYPGQSASEHVARSLANRAHYQVADPYQRERLARRLTEEFRALFPKVEPLQFEPVSTPAPGRPGPNDIRPVPVTAPAPPQPVPVAAPRTLIAVP
jgi:hypothetical protein